MIPKVGDRVFDRWWPWKAGRCIKVMKTRVKIRLDDGEIATYDFPHCRFLKRCR